jgi:hypothetical protein
MIGKRDKKTATEANGEVEVVQIMDNVKPILTPPPSIHVIF